MTVVGVMFTVGATAALVVSATPHPAMGSRHVDWLCVSCLRWAFREAFRPDTD